MPSPFSEKTPESYFAGLRRKDSRNALTTCHGVTDKGRACRRALASPKHSANFDGTVVITDGAHDPAIFYCWQHRDQVDSFTGDQRASIVELKGRHSLEEAFRSLGLEDVEEEPESSPEPSPVARESEPGENVAGLEGGARSARPIGRKSWETYPKHREKVKRPIRLERRYPAERPGGQRLGAGPEPQNSRLLSLFASCFGIQKRPTNRSHTSRREERYQAPRPTQYSSRDEGRQAKNVARPQQIASGRSPEVTVIAPQDDSVPSQGKPGHIQRKPVAPNQHNDSGIAIATDERRRVAAQSPDKPIRYPKLDVSLDSRARLDIYRDAIPVPATFRPSFQHPRLPHSDTHISTPSRQPLTARSKTSPASQHPKISWPPPLSPDATDSQRLVYAKLLTAMSEPAGKADTTPGRIYIFWQTTIPHTSAESSAVSSLLSAPSSSESPGELHRQRTILQQRFFQPSSPSLAAPGNPQRHRPDEKRTIFLKIGRAANVHQRLSQWRKQCGYDISLLRSYPHVFPAASPARDAPAARDGNGGAEARTISHVARIERLIHLHLELLGQRVSVPCRCGREHREWFEVEAKVGKVRELDRIVRGWVQWGEDRFG